MRKFKVVVVFLMIISHNPGHAIDTSSPREKTFMSSGFEAAVTGELSIYTSKIFDQSAMVPNFRAGWQFFRFSQYLALVVGAGVASTITEQRIISKKDQILRSYHLDYYGALGEIVLFPDFPVQISLSSLHGKGEFTFGSEGPEVPKMRAAIKYIDRTAELMFVINENLRFSMGVSDQSFNYQEELGLETPLDENELAYVVGIRGTTL